MVRDTGAPLAPRFGARVCTALAIVVVGMASMPSSLPRVHAAADALIVVNGAADAVLLDGACTLREAILNANSDSQSGSADCAPGGGVDTIVFNLAAGSVITLSGSRLPAIVAPLTIDGSAVPGLTVNGKVSSTLASGIFAINAPGLQVTLRGFHVADGDAIKFAGDSTGFNGGGLYIFAGDALLDRMWFSGNSAILGGAVFSNGSLTVVNSTLSANTSTANGAGIYALGAVVMRNSTISGNVAGGDGGGIFNSAPTVQVLLEYATVVNNVAAGGDGGGVYVSYGFEMSNSILANNADFGSESPDCRADYLIATGYNLIGTLTGCSTLYPPGTLPGLLLTGNPQLGPLDPDGGNIPAHTPLPGSPVIDLVPFGELKCNLQWPDQRGRPRPRGLKCDIGAIEVPYPGAALVIKHGGDKTSAELGEAIKFTTVIYNTGMQTAQNVQIHNQLAYGLRLTGNPSAAVERPSAADAGTLLVYVVTIPPDQYWQITVPTAVDSLPVLRGATLDSVITIPQPMPLAATVPAVAAVKVSGYRLTMPMIYRR